MRTLAIILCLAAIVTQACFATSVTNTVPVQNAINAEPYGTLSVTFDSPINFATVTNSTLRIWGMATGSHQATFSYVPGTNTVNAQVAQPFDYGEEVTVSISNGIHAASGPSITPYLLLFTCKTLPSSGAFDPSFGYTIGSYSYDLFGSDLDNDGDVDLVAPSIEDAWFKVLFNNGNGNFASSTIYNTGGQTSSACCLDVDADGDQDVVVSIRNLGRIIVYKNAGAGILTDSVSYSTGTLRPTFLRSSDLDGDGDMDLALAGGVGNNIAVMLNNGSGVFSLLPPLNPGNQVENIKISDFNRDGILDLVSVNATSTTITTYQGIGDGTFETGINYVIPGTNCYPNYICCGDYNADHNIDLAVATNLTGTSNNVIIYNNNGSGAFSLQAQYALGTNVYTIVAGDLEGDSDLDLIASRHGSNDARILVNSGAGAFTFGALLAASTYTDALVLADLDGDLDLDVAMTEAPGTGLKIYLQTGSPSPPPPPGFSISGAVNYYSTALPVPATTISLTGGLPQSVPTGPNGDYQFTQLPAGSYVLEPSRTQTTAQGVETNDCVAISNHLAQITPFNSYYKYIAGDVNNTGTVSISDVIKIRRYLAEIEPLPSGNWEFVRSSFILTQQNWMTAPDTISLALSSNTSGQNFTGVRMGDVNASWTSSGLDEMAPFRDNVIALKLGTAEASPGEMVSLPIYAYGLTGAAGVELHMSFAEEALEYQGMTSQVLSEPTTNNVENRVHLIWDNIYAPVTVPDGTCLATIQFLVGESSRNYAEVRFEKANICDGSAASFHLQTKNGLIRIAPVDGMLQNGGLRVFPCNPNPFNPETTLRFSLQEAGHLNLAVYDITGREVAKLLDGWQEAGMHAVTFNGSNLPSGIYLYRLQVGQHHLTGKMVLMK